MDMNQADTAWMLVSTALVLLMTPALAFFYGGLVRSKNALNTMMMSFISMGFVGVLWAVIGYSLAFAPGNNWIGDTSCRSSPRARFRICSSCVIRAPLRSSPRP
jgi:Amt family ammonium transporter